MRLISFVVPSYNSEQYLSKCVESLLTAGSDCEIIVVNDGSTDNTSQIAHDFEAQFPDIVKVIDKPNGGHGSGVNAGLATAEGLFFKVVDSDDWLDKDELLKLLSVIRMHIAENSVPDLYVFNVVKENVANNTSKSYKMRKYFPEKQICGWNKVKKFSTLDYLIMHNLLYKTELLKTFGLVLPEHTFYVDNLVAYKPLPCVQKLCFLDLDLYRYYVGRSEQSVSAQNITKRYEQQIRVMMEMVQAYHYDEIAKFPKALKRYMLHYLAQIMSLTVMFTTAGKDNKEQRKVNLKQMWASIKAYDKKTYNFLRHRSYTCGINWMPFAWQGNITWGLYKIISRILKYE